MGFSDGQYDPAPDQDPNSITVRLYGVLIASSHWLKLRDAYESLPATNCHPYPSRRRDMRLKIAIATDRLREALRDPALKQIVAHHNAKSENDDPEDNRNADEHPADDVPVVHV